MKFIEFMQQDNPNFTPLSILAAGVLIAGAIYFGGGATSQLTTSGTGTLPPTTNNGADSVAGAGTVGARGDDQVNIKPVDDQDHIKGNPDAPVKIVEFSDIDCPFCQRLHPTMQQVVDEYDGKVSWVYRHFPLTSIHPDAPKKAEAAECAGELGGNDGFWKYLDELFASTPTPSISELPQVAEDLGFDRVKFQACLDSGKYAQHVADDLADAQAAGGRGTPYSVVIASNGKTYIISGAQPYSAFKSIIDVALNDK